MKDLTSQEILDAIDRAMKKVAARFAAEARAASPHPRQPAELAEEPALLSAPRG